MQRLTWRLTENSYGLFYTSCTHTSGNAFRVPSCVYVVVYIHSSCALQETSVIVVLLCSHCNCIYSIFMYRFAVVFLTCFLRNQFHWAQYDLLLSKYVLQVRSWLELNLVQGVLCSNISFKQLYKDCWYCSQFKPHTKQACALMCQML